MILKFNNATALLLVDVQKGINDTNYYGGKNGRRNNPGAEDNIRLVLKVGKLIVRNNSLDW